MDAKSFDPEQYKAGQQQQWDSVAAGWRKWWPTIEGFSQQVSDRIMDLAGIGEGQTILDVATGIGEPAVTAARRVGPTGKVIATDHSEGMLQIARDRAADAGLANLEFRGVDGGSLNFEEAAFDAVTCRWGLMFMPDLEAAMKAIHQSLKPGGWFVTAVWGPPEKAIGISIAFGVAQKVLDLPPPPPDAPNMFKLSPPGALEAVFADAGFGDVAQETAIVDFDYETVEEYISFMQDIAAPIRLMLADKPPEKAQEVWTTLAAALQKYVGEDGRLSMSTETIIVSGRHRER